MTPRAKTAWKHFVPILRRMRVLTEADGIALERMCEAYADLIEAQESFAKPIVYRRREKTTDPDTGQKVENWIETVVAEGGQLTYVTAGQTGPMTRTRAEKAQIREADARLRSYLALFGLSPAARGRVSVLPDEKKEDPAAKYFS